MQNVFRARSTLSEVSLLPQKARSTLTIEWQAGFSVSLQVSLVIYLPTFLPLSNALVVMCMTTLYNVDAMETSYTLARIVNTFRESIIHQCVYHCTDIIFRVHEHIGDFMHAEKPFFTQKELIWVQVFLEYGIHGSHIRASPNLKSIFLPRNQNLAYITSSCMIISLLVLHSFWISCSNEF